MTGLGQKRPKGRNSVAIQSPRRRMFLTIPGLFVTSAGWTILLSTPAATVLVVTGFIVWADATMTEIPEGARAAPATRRRELPPNIGLRVRRYGTSLRNF